VVVGSFLKGGGGTHEIEEEGDEEDAEDLLASGNLLGV